MLVTVPRRSSLANNSSSSFSSNMVALCLVPEISISLAPPEEPHAEPFSPIPTSGFSIPTTPEEQDSFRPMLLTPPPSVSPRFPKQLSPLRPSDSPVSGKGLERERFEELLKTSRERNAAMGGKRSPDLRKEIALKVHRNKQGKELFCHVERLVS